VIGLIAVTAAGRSAARRLADAWPGQTRVYDGPARQAMPRAWSQCDELVCFLAVGATVRLIAPLLNSKWTDPAVVCVDEAARHAVAVVGGHAAGANALATRVAAILSADPVITTATDAAGLPGLDTLGWPTDGALGPVSRAILDGDLVRLEADEPWPLPPLPATVGSSGDYRILITDRIVPADAQTVVLRPPSLAVGVGASSGVAADEVLSLVDNALAEARLSPACVAVLATVDVKATETGITEAARERNWPLVSYPASRLAGIEVPNPGSAALAAVGTPSVAEAAALASGDDLVVAKRKSAAATVAVARIRPRGRLALIGLGPGARDLLAPRAAEELRRAAVVIGLDRYVAQVRDLLRPGTRVVTSDLGDEEGRARTAVAEARKGRSAALLGSGDAGVYALAGPALGLAGEDIDVVVVPGITASLAASALVGAPLGHDHAIISLSDLNTPWEVIERRVRAAAEADYVIAFYNPRSGGREWQLPAALGIVAEHRPGSTPAAVVREAERPGQRVVLTTVAGLDPEAVDMLSIVLVGSRTTRLVAGRMVTPRGYEW
jgi:cobalt-precorrin 5A hydrolase/precorrin-3B C17-methyltransferase